MKKLYKWPQIKRIFQNILKYLHCHSLLSTKPNFNRSFFVWSSESILPCCVWSSSLLMYTSSLLNKVVFSTHSNTHTQTSPYTNITQHKDAILWRHNFFLFLFFPNVYGHRHQTVDFFYFIFLLSHHWINCHYDYRKKPLWIGRVFSWDNFFFLVFGAVFAENESFFFCFFLFGYQDILDSNKVEILTLKINHLLFTLIN